MGRLKGSKLSLETRKKISNSLKGKEHSLNTKIKISLANKGKPKSKEHQEKLRKLRLGTRLTQEHKNKISQALKGRILGKRTKEQIEKQRQKLIGKPTWNKGKPILKLRGENHWNWKGGITKKNQIIRTSLEYKLWRRAVFERDNYACIWCGAKSGKGQKVYLHADHIKPFSLYPELRFALDNGRTLCKECHKKTDTYAGKIAVSVSKLV